MSSEIISNAGGLDSCVFENKTPATLKRGPWKDDTSFVSALKHSWQTQYADYLGDATASAYIQILDERGDLESHHEELTIHAHIDDQMVGIAALQPLTGLHIITMLEVLEAYRGKGIGAQLVQALCTVQTPVMAHVSIHQPRVKAFYIRQGFHVLQRETVQHDEYPLEFDVVAKR